jgi:hypothetical protein
MGDKGMGMYRGKYGSRLWAVLAFGLAILRAILRLKGPVDVTIYQNT